MTATAGYDRFALTLGLPLWVSEPAFAAEPFRGDENKSLAIRWTFTFTFYPEGRPEE